VGCRCRGLVFSLKKEEARLFLTVNVSLLSLLLFFALLLPSSSSTGVCNRKRNHAAAGCWQMKALQVLLPRFAPATLARLPELRHLYRGNYDKVRTGDMGVCVFCRVSLLIYLERAATSVF